MKFHHYILLIFIALYACKEEVVEEENQNIVFSDQETDTPNGYNYGFNLNDYIVERDTIKQGDNLSLILGRHSFDATEIGLIINQLQGKFDFKKLQMGKMLTALKSKTPPNKIELLIYEPNKEKFTVIDFRDSLSIYEKEYPIYRKKKTVAGEIKGSLFSSLEEAGVDTGLAFKLSEQFAWSVDFHKFQEGDRFAVSITEKYINDTIYAGIDQIHGAYFYTKGKDVYGFPFKKHNGKEVQFYNEEGKQMRTMFLKAPLKYFKITSKFSKNRFHPVQKRWKPHNGTDYAAPQGTPIMTTADGVVIETGYSSGNGNYVKVKHNATYTTQYLHMSKILVKKGQQVKQGQTIGQVGSTGLATGPHLCYRFWKNGVQVDPLKLNLPNSQSMDAEDLPIYIKEIEPVKKEIDNALINKFGQ